MIEIDKRMYGWNHKFKEKLHIICGAHLLINNFPGRVDIDEQLRIINNHYPEVIEFLDSAIRWNYPLAKGWTRKRLFAAFGRAEKLDWENYDEIKEYIQDFIEVE